jgi:hypothetical protein
LHDLANLESQRQLETQERDANMRSTQELQQKELNFQAKLKQREQELIAKGLMFPAQKPFDADAFFAIGRGVRMPRVSDAAIQRAMDFAREDVDAGILGRKRAGKTLRSRSVKPAR